ncbi:MAG: hypothetical protein Q9214_005155, partial [Letrouitia sp. 1 TL-2023]
LDDLCVRFIINLPQEELESVERICFQVEEAQWYYEDFVRPLDPDLPSLNLRNFCLRIFQHCPLLSEFSPYHHSTAFEEFLAYKTRVPVRGAILLNEAMDEVVLVKGWKKGANWSFPRGKINKDESDLDCAIREVYEETGYDVQRAGLVGFPKDTKFIDVAIQHQHLRLYVVRGVPMDTYFEARTRKEISKIDWWKLSDLPTLKKKKQQQEGRGEDLAINANKFYMVAPFLNPLKKWISLQKKLDRAKVNEGEGHLIPETTEVSLQVDPAPDGAPSSTTKTADIPTRLQQANNALMTDGVPEVSENITSINDASLQLKNLLHVPTTTSLRTEMQNTIKPQHTPQTALQDTPNAATLLALLRGPSTQHDLIPQTPQEKIIEPPSAPRSPNHHHPHQKRISNLPSPPAFPYSPDHIGQNTQDMTLNGSTFTARPSRKNLTTSLHAWQTFEQRSGEEAERKRTAAGRESTHLEDDIKTGIDNEPKGPVIEETWRQIKVSNRPTIDQPERRQVINVLKRPVSSEIQPQSSSGVSPASRDPLKKLVPSLAQEQPTASPYQVTGNPGYAQHSQYPNIYRPAIPPASKLPMPKLNAHSSALLNLFKSSQPTESVGSDVVTINQPTKGETQKATETPTPSKVDINQEHADEPPISTHAQQEVARSKIAPAAHQAALLDLFKKSPTATASVEVPRKSSLEAPAAPVELSAIPSPGHSREPSLVDLNAAKQQHLPPVAKSISIQKHSSAASRQGNPPVSATVNGPLNVPQFDMITKRQKDTNGANSKPRTAEQPKKPPVKILARPAKTQPNAAHSKGQAHSTSFPPEPTVVPSNTGAIKTAKPPTPKTFQPQILRRPAQPSLPGHQPSLPSPTAPKPTPSPTSSLERKSPSSGTQEHKQRLLSLFTKNLPEPSSPLPPANHSGLHHHDLSAFVSPVAAHHPVFPQVSRASTMPA